MLTKGIIKDVYINSYSGQYEYKVQLPLLDGIANRSSSEYITAYYATPPHMEKTKLSIGDVVIVANEDYTLDSVAIIGLLPSSKQSNWAGSNETESKVSLYNVESLNFSKDSQVILPSNTQLQVVDNSKLTQTDKDYITGSDLAYLKGVTSPVQDQLTSISNKLTTVYNNFITTQYKVSFSNTNGVIGFYLDSTKFESKLGVVEVDKEYSFYYDTKRWKYNNTIINASDYGLFYTSITRAVTITIVKLETQSIINNYYGSDSEYTSYDGSSNFVSTNLLPASSSGKFVIAHARSSDGYTESGDQTQTSIPDMNGEVSLRSFDSVSDIQTWGSFEYRIRFKNKSNALCLANKAIYAANNAKIGYNMSNRNFYTCLFSNGVQTTQLSQIRKSCSTDCMHFAAHLAVSCGMKMDNLSFAETVERINSQDTSSVVDAVFSKCSNISISNLTNTSQLQIGDIILRKKANGIYGHTCVVVNVPDGTDSWNYNGYSYNPTYGEVSITNQPCRAASSDTTTTTTTNSSDGLSTVLFIGDSRTSIMGYSVQGSKINYELIPDNLIYAKWGGHIYDLNTVTQISKIAQSLKEKSDAFIWIGINDMTNKNYVNTESDYSLIYSYVGKKLYPKLSVEIAQFANKLSAKATSTKIYVLPILPERDEPDWYAKEDANIAVVNAALEALAKSTYNFIFAKSNSETNFFTSFNETQLLEDKIHFKKSYYTDYFIPYIKSIVFTGYTGTIIQAISALNNTIKLSDFNDIKQLVTVACLDNSKAVVQFFQEGKLLYTDSSALIGKNGISKINPIETRHEGDGTTPAGLYKLGHPTFGTSLVTRTLSENGMGYFKIEDKHYWSSDTSSDDYNTLVTTYVPKAGEHLIDYSDYKWSAFVQFNYNSSSKKAINKSAGSAVFLHVNLGKSSGCIAIEETMMRNICTTLKADYNPHILIYDARSGQTQTEADKLIAEAKANLNLEVEQTELDNSQQLLLVKASSTNCDITCLDKTSGSWTIKQINGLTTNVGYVGSTGVADVSAINENTMSTPKGIYRLGTTFGTNETTLYQNLTTNSLYFKITDNSWWSGVHDTTYNTHVESTSAPGNGSEHLVEYTPDKYNYAIEIMYNTASDIAHGLEYGKGFAFFLHTDTGATSGGIGMNKYCMQDIFNWLDEIASSNQWKHGNDYSPRIVIY